MGRPLPKRAVGSTLYIEGARSRGGCGPRRGRLGCAESLCRNHQCCTQGDDEARRWGDRVARRSGRLIHGRAIGASNARLARRWVSCLHRRMAYPTVSGADTLSGARAATRRKDSAPASPLPLQPAKGWRSIAPVYFPLAESARLMPVTHRPCPHPWAPTPATSPETRRPKGLEINVKLRTRSVFPAPVDHAGP